MREEIGQLYAGVVLDGPEMPKAGPRELGPPRGVFLVGFDASGEAVCVMRRKRVVTGVNVTTVVSPRPAPSMMGALHVLPSVDVCTMSPRG